MDAIYQFDLTIFNWIKEHLWCDFLDVTMAFVSLIGEVGAVWIVLALVLLFFKKTRKTGLMVGAALIIMLIVNDNILKHLIARPRPFDFSGWVDFVYPEIAYRMPTSFSFPSGHTAASFACATVLLMRDVRIGIPAAIFAFIMGFSRIYLFDHYCTDVLGGIVVGALCGLAAYFLVNTIDKQIKKHKVENKQREERKSISNE